MYTHVAVPSAVLREGEGHGLVRVITEDFGGVLLTLFDPQWVNVLIEFELVQLVVEIKSQHFQLQ